MASLGAGKEILWDCTSIVALLHCFILSCSAVSDAVAKFVALYAASVKVEAFEHYRHLLVRFTVTVIQTGTITLVNLGEHLYNK